MPYIGNLRPNFRTNGEKTVSSAAALPEQA